MSTPAPISTSTPAARKKVTTLTYRQKKERGEIITMLTAYDYPVQIHTWWMFRCRSLSSGDGDGYVIAVR